MAEAEKSEQARAVYTTLCNFFDEQKWKYGKDDRQMKAGGEVQGNKGTYSFHFQVNPENSLVRLVLFLPFGIPKEKSTEIAVVITGLNSLLAGGCFALDAQRELGFYRISNSFYDSTLDREVFIQMLLCAVGTVDMVAEKLASFVTGKMDMEQLLMALEEEQGRATDG